MQSKTITIKGKVQGVFFRKSAQEQADIMGILGTVKNERNGAVIIQAVGDDEPMDRFIEWCHTGPQDAVIEDLVIEDLPQPTEFRRFEIISE